MVTTKPVKSPSQLSIFRIMKLRRSGLVRKKETFIRPTDMTVLEQKLALTSMTFTKVMQGLLWAYIFIL